MSTQLLLEDKLKMQLIAGVISESQYETRLTEGVFNKIKDKTITSIAKAISNKISDKVKDRLKSFMMDTFGTLTPEVSQQQANILMKKLNLDNISEAEDKFKSNESVIIKVLEALRKVAGLNLLTLTVPLQAILKTLNVSPTDNTRGDFILIPILSYIVLYILVKLMELFGYKSKGKPVTDTPSYDEEDDVREKLKNRFAKK